MDATCFQTKELLDAFRPLDHNVAGRERFVNVNGSIVLVCLLLPSGRFESRFFDIRAKTFLDVRYLFVAGGHSVLLLGSDCCNDDHTSKGYENEIWGDLALA